jgi:hypothetical protein
MKTKALSLHHTRPRCYGFAAGCEAVALPRRQLHSTIWAMPAFTNLQRHRRQSPNEGRSPGGNFGRPAGQSHRLTSGGKAVVKMRCFQGIDGATTVLHGSQRGGI